MWTSTAPNQTESMSKNIRDIWTSVNVGTRIYLVNLLVMADFEWVVYSPEGKMYSPLYSQMDHTLGKVSGNYLLLKAQSPRNVGDRAILVSDHYDIDSNRSFCLQFYYMFGKQDNQGSSRFEIYQGENNGIYTKIGQVIGTVANSTWIPFNVTAKPSSTTSKNMWFYLVTNLNLQIYMLSG